MVSILSIKLNNDFCVCQPPYTVNFIFYLYFFAVFSEIEIISLDSPSPPSSPVQTNLGNYYKYS